MYKVQKEMHTHYKELFDVSSGEHRFGLLCVSHLTDILEEIQTFTKDETVLANFIQ